MRQHAKFRRNRWNRSRDITIYRFFFKIWPSTILDLCGKFWDNPRVFGGLYHCTKFGWNRISHFDNTKV